jgi:hypothetical protein
MSSKAIAGLKPVALATMVPGGTAPRHSHRCRLRRSPDSSSTFLRPFAPDPLQVLPRSYGRSDSCSPRPITVCSTAVGSVNEQVSLIHALGLPAIPSPTTGHCSASPGRGTLPHQRVGPRWHPTNGFLPRGTRGLHLCTFPWQARHRKPAESSSASSPVGETSYGLAVHLLLLSTPSRDDAVAVGYELR